MPVIGLTGGIATGKSTVGRLLEERGAVLISADAISHAVTAPGSAALSTISHEIGPEYLLGDGTLDRKRLAESVFSEPGTRKKLEGILHPIIQAELRRKISEALAVGGDPLIVVEVPLLFETGMQDWFTAVLTVIASQDAQMQRLMERSRLSPVEADTRMNAQMPLAEKAARSRFVLDNSGTLQDLESAVDAILPRLRAAL